MGKNGTLKYQLLQNLESRKRIGHSRHKDKDEGISDEYIYSYSTLDNYKRIAAQFANWMKKEHPEIKDVSSARNYVGTYLQYRIDSGLTAATVHKDASAFAKIYDCSSYDFSVELPKRIRNEIKRGRDRYSDTQRHRNFREENHKEFVTFCKCFGCRRGEYERLKVCDVSKDENGNYQLYVTGKGGKSRYCPFCGDENEIKIVEQYINEHTFEKQPNAKFFSAGVNTNANIHAYRADYAQKMYQLLARPISETPLVEQYICRNDLFGKRFDKVALAKVSQALGHGEGRYGTVVTNYLYKI